MNIFRILGTVEAKIDGFDSGLIINKLRKECKVLMLYVKNDSVYIQVPYTNRRLLEKLCSEHGFSLEIIKEKGLYYKLFRYRKRFGLIVGAVICTAAMIYLSNCVLKVRVVGADGGEVEERIKLLLAEDGIRAGGYIPSINFLDANAKLMEMCDEVAWASIGHSGSVVTVNVSLLTERVPTDLGRIPCNLVASRDGQIVSVNVLEGELCVLLGDTVKKGDILVNGIIERRNGLAYYYHSMATITAVYDETVEFEQALYDRAVVDGETVYSKNLCFFDYEIPKPWFKTPDGSCKIKTYSSPVSFFGIELPVSVKTTEYTEQISKLKIYTYEEAEKILRQKLKIYEDNLLGDSEILNCDVELEMSDDVLKLKAVYSLKGNIAKESPIYVDSKNRLNSISY